MKKQGKKLDQERTPTGIKELDKAIEGGFCRNSSNLIAGGPGSGKTIFCMEYLINGIEKYNEPGILISFEESNSKILRDMQSFNWDLRKKIADNKLKLLYYTPEQVEHVLHAGGGVVRDLIDEIGAKRIVIDSLTSFAALEEDELEKRKLL